MKGKSQPLGPTKFAHHSEGHKNRLGEIIIKSIFKGGLYGALISIPTDLLLRWKSPMFRMLGLRGWVFYHTIWVSAGASFHTEREVMKFESLVRWEEKVKRDRLIEMSVLNGDYDDEYDTIRRKKKAKADSLK